MTDYPHRDLKVLQKNDLGRNGTTSCANKIAGTITTLTPANQFFTNDGLYLDESLLQAFLCNIISKRQRFSNFVVALRTVVTLHKIFSAF